MTQRSTMSWCAAAACAVVACVPAGNESEIPERLRTGVAMDSDRSGDLRPEAIAVSDALAAHGVPPPDPRTTLAQFTPPETIRVWRRRLDDSTSSCAGRVDVIPFEDYVKGVLPHEWIASWHVESLKAGAVAIRTYAAWWVRRGGKYECADLDDTSSSQVYKDERLARTDAAAEATRGIYVVAGDKLVLAEYSAENGDPTKHGVVEPHCTGRARDGHGRGTCQRGSQRWASRDGKTFDWIVTHYYPGSTLLDTTVDDAPDEDDPLGELPPIDEARPDEHPPVAAGCAVTDASPWTVALVLLTAAFARRRSRARATAHLFADARRPCCRSSPAASRAAG